MVRGSSYSLEQLFSFFPGDALSDKIGVTKSNKILLNSMPESWSKQASVCAGFLLWIYYVKKIVNMFERMEIAE